MLNGFVRQWKLLMINDCRLFNIIFQTYRYTVYYKRTSIAIKTNTLTNSRHRSPWCLDGFRLGLKRYRFLYEKCWSLVKRMNRNEFERKGRNESISQIGRLAKSCHISLNLVKYYLADIKVFFNIINMGLYINKYVGKECIKLYFFNYECRIHNFKFHFIIFKTKIRFCLLQYVDSTHLLRNVSPTSKTLFSDDRKWSGLTCLSQSLQIRHAIFWIAWAT